MTTADLDIHDVTDGRSAYMHGGLFGRANDLAYAIYDALVDGMPRVVSIGTEPYCAHFEVSIPGDVLIELIREIEHRKGYTLVPADGLTLDWVVPAHQYRVEFIEF